VAVSGAVRSHDKSFAARSNLPPIAAELLAEGDRDSVHQMRSARLTTSVNAFWRPRREVDRWCSAGSNRSRVASTAATRMAVGKCHAGLAGVHVVVGWTSRPVARCARRATTSFHVHVRGGARPGLEDIDGELVVVQALGNLVGGQGDGTGDVGITKDRSELTRAAADLIWARAWMIGNPR